ncbi:MAG: glycosyltransferase family 39 protein [Candidatus Altiarchaeales archaeon]|nr:glycosyltransferase family 39 protein [Candidatus Altiarchaeales archaeon]
MTDVHQDFYVKKIKDIAGKNQVIIQIFFILLLAILLRAITFNRCHYIHADEFAYFLAAGEIYKAILANNLSYLQTIETFHLPLIPIQVASVFLLIGKVDLLAGRSLIVVYNILSVPLTYVLAYTISNNKKISFFSSLLFAFNQAFWMNADTIWLDIPSTFFLLLFLILVLNAIEKRKNAYGIYSGIVLGLLFMTKEYMLIFLYPIIFLTVFIEISRSSDASFPCRLILYNIAIPLLFIIFYVYSSALMPSSRFVADEAGGGVYNLDELNRMCLGLSMIEHIYHHISSTDIPSIVLFLAVYGMFLRHKKRFHPELIILTFLFIVIFGRRLGNPYTRYLFPVYPLLYIFATYAIFNHCRPLGKTPIFTFSSYKDVLLNSLKITAVITVVVFVGIDVGMSVLSLRYYDALGVNYLQIPTELLFLVGFASFIYLFVNIFRVQIKDRRLMDALRAVCILAPILFGIAYTLTSTQIYEIEKNHLGPEYGWDKARNWVVENINSSTRVLSDNCIYLTLNSDLGYQWRWQKCIQPYKYRHHRFFYEGSDESEDKAYINNYIEGSDIDFLTLNYKVPYENISSYHEKLRDFDNLVEVYRQEKDGNLQIAIFKVVRDEH